MKKSIFILLLFLTSSVFGQTFLTPQQKPMHGLQVNWAHPLSKGIVGFWLMNEGTGPQVFDLSGNGNTGTFVNETFWETAQTGPGIGADGSDDSVSFSWSKLGITGYPFSVVWAATHHTLNQYSNMILFSDSDSANNSFFVGINDNNKCTAVAYKSGWDAAETTQTVAAGERVSGAAVFRSNTDRRAYINGGGEAINTDADDVVFGNIDRFNLFLLERNPDVWYKAKKFEYLYIYNRVLSASEITELHSFPFCMFEEDNIAIMAKAAEAPPPTGGQVITVIMSAMPLFVIFTFVCFVKRKRWR